MNKTIFLPRLRANTRWMPLPLKRGPTPDVEDGLATPVLSATPRDEGEAVKRCPTIF